MLQSPTKTIRVHDHAMLCNDVDGWVGGLRRLCIDDDSPSNLARRVNRVSSSSVGVSASDSFGSISLAHAMAQCYENSTLPD